MKERKVDWFTSRKLAAWGISVIPRPDYWDDRNRKMTIVIDESLDDDTLVIEDGITFRMSVFAADEFVATLAANVCDQFMELFVASINSYSKWNMVLIKKASGTSFLEQALDRIQFVLDTYHVGIKRFTELDYMKCVRHFGGERNFRQLIRDAVCYNISDQLTMCLICKNCRCKRNGERVCRKVYVPVEEGSGVRTLRITADYPISNKLTDIIPTFEQREECGCFEPNGTALIDWAVRFRNAHF